MDNMKRTVDTPYCAVPTLDEALVTRWFPTYTAALVWVSDQTDAYDVQFRPKKGYKR